MRKTRVQSPLDLLPLHVKQALHGWLTTGGAAGQGLTYIEAKRKLQSEYGVKASVTALCKFFQRHDRSDGTPPSTSVNVVGSKTGKTISVVITLPN